MFGGAFRDKTVWLSGATGFKGAWLAEWLLQLGARVHGFSLAPATTPALFNQLQLAKRIKHEVADIRDAASVRRSLLAVQPDWVFHLAAQSLVRPSYEQPVVTYETNVMGTVHVLDALRLLDKPCGAVMITSDKCYENREWLHGYREEDPLGGRDPYSSSKAAAEIAIASWQRSFFANHPVRISSARAGNVIGGGDWAPERILPDCIRALAAHQPIPVRNPQAVRPWQHVLEPLSGYLCLAVRSMQPGGFAASAISATTAFNFGPEREANRTVRQLVEEILRHWPGSWEDRSAPDAVHEAQLLQLSTDKARALLGWVPVWHFNEAVQRTIAWYRQAYATSDPAAILEMTRAQLADYIKQAVSAGAGWST